MKLISYWQYVKEKRVFHSLDKIVLITTPIIFVLILYVLDHFVAEIIKTRMSIVALLIPLIFIMFILQSRALERDIKEIDSMIKKEIETLIVGEHRIHMTWKHYKTRFFYIEIVPAVLLLIISLFVMIYPFGFLKHYFREITIILLTIYLFLFGLFKLISYRDYLNNLIMTYRSIAYSSEKFVDNLFNLKYYFNEICIQAGILTSLTIVSLHYLVLQDAQFVQLILFALAVYALYILLKGLYRAHKGFYESLGQIDKLRDHIYEKSKGAGH